MVFEHTFKVSRERLGTPPQLSTLATLSSRIPVPSPPQPDSTPPLPFTLEPRIFPLHLSSRPDGERKGGTGKEGMGRWREQGEGGRETIGIVAAWYPLPEKLREGE